MLPILCVLPQSFPEIESFFRAAQHCWNEWTIRAKTLEIHVISIFLGTVEDFQYCWLSILVYDRNRKNWFRPNIYPILPSKPPLFSNFWVLQFSTTEITSNWILQNFICLNLIWREIRLLEYEYCKLICIWFNGNFIKLNTANWFAFDLT